MLYKQEGRCLLWVTRDGRSGARKTLLRWEADESPLGALLERCAGRWGFATTFHASQSGRPASEGSRLLDAVLSAAEAFSQVRVTSGADVLFSGSPALLDPVAEAMLRQEPGLRALRIRPLRKLSDLRWAARRGTVCVAQRTRTLSAPIDGERIRTFLERQGDFIVRQADLLPALWPAIENFYRHHAPGLIADHRRHRRLLERLRPKYLVLDEDVIELNRSLAAASRPARSVVVQHGVPGDAQGFVPLKADRFAAWGEYSRGVLEEWGMPADRISVTGCPRYDKLAGTALPAPKMPVVLVATPSLRRHNGFERFRRDVPPSIVAETAEHFIRAAREFPTLSILFKFHPGAWYPAVYERLEREQGGLPANFKWVREGASPDLVRGASLVFNSMSSMFLEALMLKRPIVHMNFRKRPDDYPYDQYGLGATVYSYEDLRNVLRQLAEGRLPAADWLAAQEQAVEPFLFSRDGRSAERAARFIREEQRELEPIRRS